MRKTILAFAFLLIVILLCGPKVFCQSEYDTTSFKRVVIADIKPSMITGGQGFKFTVVSGNDTVYAYFNRASKADWQNYKQGTCLLLAISQWNDLLKNKK
jgi:hypothetical protein